METMKCPKKYRAMGEFPKYYSGQVPVPVPTICIGGNHEAVGYLRELRYGGWLAPNMYFLGSSGVIRFGSLRIGGISGVKKPSAYTRPFECPPFDPRSMESAYGMRKDDIDLLQQIAQPLDIMMSHDWPEGMEEYGDAA